MPRPIAARSKVRALLLAGVLLASPSLAGGRITAESLDSPHLGRALPYQLYVPQTVQGRLPVLYLYHGLRGDETDWPTGGGIAEILDTAIKAKVIPPLFAVMPGVGNSWYVDSEAFGPIATTLSDDLLPAIDAKLPTQACRTGRAVAGLSMGGLGAVLQGLRHPDRYGTIISLSGSLFDPVPPNADSSVLARFHMFGAVFGQPMEPARYNAANAFLTLAALPASGSRPDLWFAAGDDDYPSILVGSAKLHIEAQRLGLASELRVIDGGHSWGTWRQGLTEALAWLGPHLKPCAG
jgi:enterochelin esterase family protein